MRSFLVLTESGPILTLTSGSAKEVMVGALTDRGIDKFIAYEVPVDAVRERYGKPFEVIASDIAHGRNLRVLDFDGRHIFDCLPLSSLGRCYSHEH